MKSRDHRFIVFEDITKAYRKAQSVNPLQVFEALVWDYTPPQYQDALRYFEDGHSRTAHEVAVHFGWLHDAQARRILAHLWRLGFLSRQEHREGLARWHVYQKAQS